MKLTDLVRVLRFVQVNYNIQYPECFFKAQYY